MTLLDYKRTLCSVIRELFSSRPFLLLFITLTSSSTIWLPKANVHARACYFIASVINTEKLGRLHLQRRKASIRSAPWNVRPSGCTSDAFLKASPARWVSICTEKWGTLFYPSTWNSNTQISNTNILPMVGHVTVRFVAEDDSSFPSWSTHQHSPVEFWHCSSS